MKATITETTNIHEQRVWIVRFGGKSRSYRKKVYAKRAKARLEAGESWPLYDIATD